MPRASKPANGTPDSPKPARTSKKANGHADNFNGPDAVARRAYEIYLNRGGHHGADLDDWLEAERQLKSSLSDLTGPAPAKPRRRKSSAETA